MILRKLAYSLLLTASVAVMTSCGKTESPPSTPGGLTATGSSSKIDLAWSSASGATSYKIYYNTTGGVTNKDSSIAENSTSYSHTGLSIGQTYYYRVAAVNGGGESGLSDETSASVSCVSTHEGAVWTKSACGPDSAVFIDQGTAGDNGEALGDRSVNKGKLSFKVSNISDSIPFGEHWNLWFLAHVANGGGESNFQMMVVDSFETRFIQQRFDDFTACSPRGLAGGRWGCEEQDIHGDMYMDPSRTFQYECQWNQNDDYRVSCDVTATDGSFSTHYEISMGGGYSSLKEFKVGSFSIYGYGGVDCLVSDFRFSVM